MEYLKVGRFDPEAYAKGEDGAGIRREFYGQGDIFKDEEAFELYPDRVCYIPELSDSPYTHNDFLALCDGIEVFARELFETVDWQCPETLMEDWLASGEWGVCENCNQLYTRYDKERRPCSKCGKELEYDEDYCFG